MEKPSLYEGKPAKVLYYEPEGLQRRRRIRESLKNSDKNNSNRSIRSGKRRSISAKKFQNEILNRMKAAEMKKERKIQQLKEELDVIKMKEIKIFPKDTEIANNFLKRMEKDILDKRANENNFEIEKKAREEKRRKESEELKDCTFAPNYNKEREKRRSNSRRHIEKLLNWKNDNRRLKITLKQKYEQEEDEKIKRNLFISNTGGSARLHDSPETKWVNPAIIENSPMRGKSKSLRASSKGLRTEERIKQSSRKFSFKGKSYKSKPPVYNRERKFRNKESLRLTKDYISKYNRDYLCENNLQSTPDYHNFRLSHNPSGGKFNDFTSSTERKYSNSRQRIKGSSGKKKSRRNSIMKKLEEKGKSRSSSRVSGRKVNLIKKKVEEKKKKIMFKKNEDEKKINKNKNKVKKRMIKYTRPKTNNTEKKNSQRSRDYSSNNKNGKWRTENDKKMTEEDSPEFEPQSFVLSTDNSFVDYEYNIVPNEKKSNKNMFEKIEIKKEEINLKKKKEKRIINPSKNSRKRDEKKSEKSLKLREKDNLRKSLGQLHESILKKSPKSGKSGSVRKSLQKLKKSFERHLKEKSSSRERNRNERKNERNFWMGAVKY